MPPGQKAATASVSGTAVPLAAGTAEQLRVPLSPGREYVLTFTR